MASGTSSRPRNKRAAAETLIRQYFVQLTEGCHKDGCNNPSCATGSGKRIDKTQAASVAVNLVKKKATLCVSQEQAVLKSDSAKSLVMNSVHNSSSVLSTSSTSSEPGPGPTSETHPSEAMEVTDSTTSSYRIDPSVSTDSLENSSPLILVHSRASNSSQATIPRPIITPPPPTQTPSPSVTTFSSNSSSSAESSTTTSSSSYGLGITSSSSSGLRSILENPDLLSSDSMEISSPPLLPLMGEGREGGVAVSSSLVKLDMGAKRADAPFLTEALVNELIEKARAEGDSDYKELTNTIWLVFSNPESLNKSFVLPEDNQTEINLSTRITVDVQSVRRTYNNLFSLGVDRITNTMGNAIDMYHSFLRREKAFTAKESLSHFVVLLENPLLHSPEFMKAFPKLLRTIVSLPIDQKERLVRWFAHYSIEELQNFVSGFHQLITLQLLLSEEQEHSRYYIPQSDPAVAAATHTMDLFFFANLLKAKQAGDMKELSSGLNSAVATAKPEFLRAEDSWYTQLLARLQVHPALVIKWPIQYSEFVNEELNNRVSMSIDYHREFQGADGSESQFSFLDHPFILSTANKMEKLLRDNLVSMYSERRRAVVHSMITGVPDLPFLILRVGRDDIVSSALVQLEATADLNPIDLRKQLRVEFHGEEGIDEGGLQKEFFQLIVEKLFDPMHGMFIFDEDTQQHWINPMSYESEEQYRLIGLLLGLAIYNNIILDIRFPLVIYSKLIGCPIQFEDLYSSHPQIAQSLKSMLDFEGEPEEFESTFMATFEVSFSDMFGTLHTHSLKEGGEKTPVTMDNVKEYVDLYTNWLLNESIASSFDAFKRGFDLVMSHSYLADLFTAEEVEMLICGSQEWDIDALEESTRYDGFTPEHPVIVNFWQIVRRFTDIQKKQLLAFITGSDRIPLGGLAKLKFIIVKNGPDSDRLPTAHTCFNALMVCDYSSKEKLEERLTKAISHAKGFGMI